MKMKNDGFKRIEKFPEEEKLVLFYEDQPSRPVLIRDADIPKAIFNNIFGSAVVTNLLDQFICNTFGCFINRMSPDYRWVQKELANMQMSGAEDVVVEYAELG